jgi:hypothetical protein
VANFCSECGERISGGEAKFCPNCGTSLFRKAASQEPTVTDHSAEATKLEQQAEDPNRIQNIYKKLYSSIYGFEAPLVTPDDITEGALGWENANRTLITNAASAWWGTPVFSDSQLLVGTKSQSHPISDNVMAISQYFTPLNNVLEDCDPVAWDKSEFGSTFLKVIKSSGLILTNSKLGTLVKKVNDEGIEEAVWWNDKPRDYYLGKFETQNGFPFCEIGQVFKSRKTGKEYVYWYIEALVRTRFADEDKLPHPSHTTFIPYVLQNALYLAETPFPSPAAHLMFSGSRTRVFGVEQNESLPIPLIELLSNQRVWGVNKTDHSDIFTDMAPEVTRLGYVFDDSMSNEAIIRFVSIVVSSLVKVQGILLDGFANFNEGNSLNFQTFTCSDYQFQEDKELMRTGLVVPGMLYGELCMRSEIEYKRVKAQLESAKASGDLNLISQALDEMFAIVDYGVGVVFLFAENDAAYTFYQAKLPPSKSLLDVLIYISNYYWDSQHLNAVSNYVLLLMQIGYWEAAETGVEIGLNRDELSLVANLSGYNSAHWNFDVENGIKEELFESYYQIKSKLGKEAECRAMAPKVIEFCLKNNVTGSLLNLARSFAPGS